MVVSGEEVVREKLMQHFKKVNEMNTNLESEYKHIDNKNEDYYRQEAPK